MYPVRQPIPNPYQIVGQAAQDIGGQVTQYGKTQDELAERFRLMMEKRAEAQLKQQQDAEEAKLKGAEEQRKQAEFDAKAKTEEAKTKFLAEFTGADQTDPANQVKLKNALTAGIIDPQTYKVLQPKEPERFSAGGGYYELGPDGKPKQLVAPKPDGFAGLTRAQISTENNLRGQNNNVTKDYDVAKRAAQAFQSDYDEYRKMISSGNKEAIKIAQQGMLDKYITASTNKATGDAQFKNFMSNQGLNSSIDNLYDKIVNGSMAPDVAIKTMRDITMSTAMKALQKTKQANAASQGMVESTNKSHDFSIDPTSVIVHPPEMLTQDSVGYAQPSFDSSKPVVETKVFRGVTYELTPGKPRNDPKSWVPVKHE